MSKPYKPISCDFHELLLAKATLKERCYIVYTSSAEEIKIESIIIDVYTKSGEEFMLLENGTIIRLDHIISLNDTHLPDISCTF